MLMTREERKQRLQKQPVNDDYLTFQAEFTKWQKRFGLMGYRVTFSHEPVPGCFADISTGWNDQCAHVRFSAAVKRKERERVTPAETAKHEACHLLIDRLESLARSRYTRAEEIKEASEELCRKLETLIPDQEADAD